jgi:tetratricopeptide (TPR) repeat protein
MDRGGEHPALYNILGVLQERQGKSAIAKDFYNRALNMSEFFAPALVNRANLYVATGETSMAESDYKKALDAEPSNTDAMIGLAVVYRQTGRFNAAKEILERTLDLDADNPQARFNLAILMRENVKDEGLALRYFNEVTQSDRANQTLRTMAKSAIEEIRSL